MDEPHPELSCVKCGACTVVCPVFRVEPREALTARGKMHLLSLPLAHQPSGHFQDIFSRCLLCGACETACSRNLPIIEMVTRARSGFSMFYGNHGLQKAAARKALSSTGLLQGLVRAGISLKRINALPARSGLRIKLGLLEDPRAEPIVGEPDFLNTSPEDTLSYFSGCLARHLQPSVGQAVLDLVHAGNRQVWNPATQGCCGLAASAAGKADEARELAWRNIETFASGRGPILTSCASCSSHLATYPELFAGDPEKQEVAKAFSSRVVEFSSFFLNHLQDTLMLPGNKKIKIFFHDPCHQRFSKAGRQAPRNLIDRIGNLERVEAAGGPQCCGQGGLFYVGYPDLSRKIFQRCVDGALVHSPDLVTTTCSGCLMQWQQGVVENNLPVRVRHLALLLADCLG